jgi:hypothetical protein
MGENMTPKWFPESLEWWRFKDWLNVDLFEELLENRIAVSKRKNINTPLAVKKLLNRLHKQYHENWPIDAMLEEAIVGGWKTTFTSNHEQKRQRPLTTNVGPLFEQVSTIKKSVAIPEPSNRGRKALQALQSVLNEHN